MDVDLAPGLLKWRAMSFLERERRRGERWRAQGALYVGLYDGGEEVAAGPVGYVMLNALCRDDDPAAQRFAHIEVD
jgi:hypothetical protein